MTERDPTILWRYGGALALVAVAILIRWALDPWVGDSMHFATLYAAFAATLWLGGYRPAILAAVVGYLACNYVFLEPRGFFSIRGAKGYILLLTYAVSSAVVIGLGETMRRRLKARKHAETARRVMEQLRIVTETLSAPVNHCSRDLTYIWVSEHYAKWLGKPREEIQGRPIEEILGTDAFRSLLPHFQQVLSGKEVRYEAEVDFLGLGRRSVQAVYTPTFSSDGAVEGWVAVVLDRTEAKRTADALRASEERFQRFMDASPVPAYIKDGDGRYLYANPVVERKFSGSPLGKTDLELFPMDTAEEIRRNDRMVLSSGKIARFHEVTDERDGRHDYLSFKFPLDDPEGRRLVAGMSLDLTEQKRAEQLVREGEERFRTLADHAPVLIWLNDLDGCQFVNRAYLDFTGREMDEVRGMKWADAIHPDDAPAYLEKYRRGMTSRETVDAQFRFRRSDGEFRWLKSVAVPRFTRDGRFLGFAGCSLDITEIKEYEETLKEQDRRKDEFVATLAHELRNPLAPIQSAVEILKAKGPPVPDLMWARDVIDRQARLMARLLDDLLDVNRITRGKLELRKERVELRAVVDRAVETSRPLITMSGHDLDVRLPSEPIALSADPVRLEQVISNLLNNAARYTNPGGHILLTAEATPKEVVIRVKDDGVGIAPDVLPRVFDLFTQAASPAGSKKGLGIGLSMVRSLVTLHGGSVEALSNYPGKGSEFVVKLPIDTPSIESPIPSQAPLRSLLPRPKLRIVIADDNRDAAESLAMILRILGHEVRTAHDGLEALSAVSDLRPDVVLLDIGMPGMNGYDCARRIRQEPWGTGIVLLAVSGWGQEEDKRRAREAGFDHHLTKPVDSVQIERVLAPFQAGAATT